MIDVRFRRLVSCFIDHAIMTVIGIFITFPGMLFQLFENRFEMGFYFGNPILNTFALNIYLCKDLIFSNGIGKRILRFRIQNSNLDLMPNAFQLYVRNLTFFLWPIEVFFLIQNPNKRLGDIIAKTKVVEGLNTTIQNGSSRILVFLLALPISYFFILLMSIMIEILNDFLFWRG